MNTTNSTNFIITFLKQEVCLKFLIVNQFFFVFFWSFFKIVFHYMDIPLSSHFGVCFLTFFFIVWISSLAFDSIIKFILKVIYHTVVINYIQFCEKFLNGFISSFQKSTVFVIQLHLILCLFYFAHILGVIDTPVIVSLYFLSYTLRTIFVAPLLGLFLIENHVLYKPLLHRLYMNEIGSQVAKELGNLVKATLQKPELSGPLGKVLVTSAGVLAGAEVYKQDGISAVGQQKELLRGIPSNIPMSPETREKTMQALLPSTLASDRAELTLRQSSGLAHLASDVKKVLTGKPTFKEQLRETGMKQAEILRHTEAGLPLPSHHNNPVVPSILEDVFFF